MIVRAVFSALRGIVVSTFVLRGVSFFQSCSHRGAWRLRYIPHVSGAKLVLVLITTPCVVHHWHLVRPLCDLHRLVHLLDSPPLAESIVSRSSEIVNAPKCAGYRKRDDRKERGQKPVFSNW